MEVRTRTRLQEIRKTRGLAAAELARQVGISRQTIYAIEDGSYVPNTATALRLAHALETRVEELFSLEEPTGSTDQSPLRAELLTNDRKEEQFVRLCRVGEHLLAVPSPSLPDYLPLSDGIIQRRSGNAVWVKPFGELPNNRKRLLLAGCDPALSVLAELLTSSGIEVINFSCSSQNALQWLKRGRVHIAGSHLLDHATGEYNVPFIQRAFPQGSVRVVTFALWEEGIVVQRGNPKNITCLADLSRKGVKIVNREKGSGSRDLLDVGLRAAGIATGNVKGYGNMAHGHLPAAYIVATENADCCIATQSAARRFGLDFVPLASERFDLTFSQASLELSAAKALLEALNQTALRRKLQLMAGYETQQTGAVQL